MYTTTTTTTMCSRSLRHEQRAALEHSTPARTKTVLQAMIENICVDARDHIEPTFRAPAVREPCGSMDLRREFSNSGPAEKSLVKRLLRRVAKGAKVAREAPVTVFEDAHGPPRPAPHGHPSGRLLRRCRPDRLSEDPGDAADIDEALDDAMVANGLVQG